ncbi:hypothetical protein AKO1_012586 [Acrasis kona]|uniref:Proline-rich protein PRCC n=1 Tax=Acrasis kona TaxID=1008807 RepID=A0AAW2YUS0_9EUKA
MLGLSGYGSSDDESPPKPTPTPQASVLTAQNVPAPFEDSEATTTLFKSLPKPNSNGAKKKRKRNVSDIAAALGLNSMVQNDEEVIEEPTHKKHKEHNESHNSKEPEPTTSTPKFVSRVPSEVPESISSAPAMREGSDFMKKFSSIISNKNQDEETLLNNATIPVQNSEEVRDPNLPKPPPIPSSLFKTKIQRNMLPTSYMRTMKNKVIKSKPELSVPTQPVLNDANINDPTNDMQEEEFEMDADSVEVFQEPEEEERPQLFVPKPIISQEVISDIQFPQPKLTVGEALRRERDSMKAASRTNNNELPPNLPTEVLRELAKSGSQPNIIDVTDKGSQYADEAAQRKIMMDKHQQSIYMTEEEKASTLRPFNQVQRTRNQITFLAKSAVVSQMNFLESSGNARASKAKTWGKYGWM